MADTILTPGQNEDQDNQVQPDEETKNYLIKDNYLGEFDTDVDKNLARENIGVYPKESVYTKEEADLATNQKVQEALQQHLDTPDPHGTQEYVRQELLNYIKRDGSTPFTFPQTGVDPISDFHLVTKRWVTNLINEHINADDPHQILPRVQKALQQYATIADVYLKGDVYNTREIDSKLGDYIKKDGTTAFTRPQYGVDPTVDSHLSTKRYVDLVMQSHLTDVDPHGFISLLNQRLASYYRKTDVYNKSEVYSRNQIDAIIRSLVNEAAQEAINDALSVYDTTLNDKILKGGFIKDDGSVPFTKPQKGVEAVDDNDLVVYSQLKNISESFPIWHTSGPASKEVGYVTEGYEFAQQYNVQDIMDLIFYGATILVDSPDYANVGDVVDVNCEIHGSLAGFIKATLYQNDIAVKIIVKNDLVDNKIVVKSNTIFQNTTFKLVCEYENGLVKEGMDTTKVAYGVFVGTLKKWQPGNTVTFEQLQEQVKSDPTNNTFTTGVGQDVIEIKQKYSFEDPELRHIFIATQVDYPSLKQMSTIVQQFTRDAFDVLDVVPLKIPNVEGNTLYKFYIFKQAQAKMDLEVTFIFNQDESVQPNN